MKDKEIKEQTIFIPGIQDIDYIYGANNNIHIHYPLKGIRKRVSYAFWKPIIKEMIWMPFDKMVDSVSQIWNQMDMSHKFNTRKQSGFELESMTLCLLEAKDSEVKGEQLKPATERNSSVSWNKINPTNFDEYYGLMGEEEEEEIEEETPF
jgi:hypothetical protein|tara:strand:- start:857 stop:1309 length:453 start_codon:yes stop_codon:yes gene_type:complete